MAKKSTPKRKVQKPEPELDTTLPANRWPNMTQKPQPIEFSAEEARKKTQKAVKDIAEERQRKKVEEQLEKGRRIDAAITRFLSTAKLKCFDAITATCKEGYRAVAYSLDHEFGDHILRQLGAWLIEMGYSVTSPAYVQRHVEELEVGQTKYVWEITVSW